MSGKADDAFFVGYLKMPPKLALFIAFVCVLLAGLGIGGGFAMLAERRDYGNGDFIWQYTEHQGVLQNAPYPVLRMPPSAEYPKGHTLVLSGGGQNGAQGPAKGLDGAIVDVGGVFITREGTSILEVGGAANIRAAKDPAPIEGFVPAADIPLGTVTLRGEIVDSKCYLGAMRPGEGKVHRSCANVCLMGGIPPMLAVFHENAPASLILLADKDGNALQSDILGYVAPYVSIEGELFRRDDLLILRTASERIALL